MDGEPGGCVFCRIVGGTAPASFVHETEQVVAFLDIDPVTPGHTLVVPRAHLPSLADLTDGLASEMVVVARHLAAALRRTELRCDGVDLFYADGEAAFQEVFRQPGSRVYRAMTAVAYYAGLRPSEVAMLRVRSLTLPAEGWGLIDVTEADTHFDVPGEPKTGPRQVPIPAVLVAILRAWIDEKGLSGDDLLFRTREGSRPSQSNWARALHRALEAVGHPSIRVYDCRHAAATTWLNAGVPLGEVAKRMGHSVETLVSTYVGALQDDQSLANHRIDAALGSGL